MGYNDIAFKIIVPLRKAFPLKKRFTENHILYSSDGSENAGFLFTLREWKKPGEDFCTIQFITPRRDGKREIDAPIFSAHFFTSTKEARATAT